MVIIVPIVGVMFVLEAFESPPVNRGAGNTRSTNVPFQVIKNGGITSECLATSVALFGSRQMHLEML